MRFFQGLFLLTLAACGSAAQQAHVPPQQPTAPQPQPSPTSAARANPNQEVNDRYVQQILQKVAGHENEPAEKVFKNVQWLAGVPAKQFLGIMNVGYSRALGVSCTHCHVEQDFASDDKRPKRAAREMAVMHRMINEQLKKMQNLELEPQDRTINCTTCHRGAVDPRAS